MIKKIMLMMTLVLLVVPMVVAHHSLTNLGSHGITASYTRDSPESSYQETQSSSGGGGGCVTKLGTDGKKMDLYWMMGDKVIIIDGSYCAAWDMKNQKILYETPHTPLISYNNVLPISWWRPENRELW